MKMERGDDGASQNEFGTEVWSDEHRAVTGISGSLMSMKGERPMLGMNEHHPQGTEQTQFQNTAILLLGGQERGEWSKEDRNSI